jgi:hypothetical protein
MTASYDVKFWDTRRIGDTRRGRFVIFRSGSLRGRGQRVAFSVMRALVRCRRRRMPESGVPVKAGRRLLAAGAQRRAGRLVLAAGERGSGQDCQRDAAFSKRRGTLVGWPSSLWRVRLFWPGSVRSGIG